MRIAKNRVWAAICAIMLATGCVSGESGTAPVAETTPESAVAAASDPQTLAVLPTGKLSGCLLEAPPERSALPEDVANFDAEATRAFATRMAKGDEPVRALAAKVRAYSYVPGPTAPAGETPLTCYFEKRRDDIRFLTWIAPTPDPIAQEAALNEAVLVSYAKMSGKSIAKVRAQGIYAQ
jgi:hypothetical protein